MEMSAGPITGDGTVLAIDGRKASTEESSRLRTLLQLALAIGTRERLLGRWTPGSTKGQESDT